MGRPHNADRPNEGSSSHSLHSIDPEDDLPPPYTDEPSLPQVAYGVSQELPTIPSSLEIVDSAYALPDTTGNKSTDRVVFTTNPTLSRNSNALYDVARRQIRLPPRPLLYISGSHSESNSNGDKKASNKVTDFHFKLDLAETLLTGWEKNGNTDGNMWTQVSVISDDHDTLAYRGTRMPSRIYNAPKSRAIALPTDGDDEALLASDSVDNPIDDASVFNPVNKPIRDLKRWCDRFCEDPSVVKSFTITRNIQGFDADAMSNVLTSHVRSLNYLGNLSCATSIAQFRVTIYSPHWINRMRANRYIWWTFVILQLWIITWPIIFFLEKRYEVVNTTWHASLEAGEETGLVKLYARQRSPTTLAEYWAPAVKLAAWSRRQGDHNTLTRLDADRVQGMSNNQLLGLQRHVDSEAEAERRARVDRGQGGFVDNVVGLVRGVGEVQQEWRLATGWGGNN